MTQLAASTLTSGSSLLRAAVHKTALTPTGCTPRVNADVCEVLLRPYVSLLVYNVVSNPTAEGDATCTVPHGVKGKNHKCLILCDVSHLQRAS